jgi:integrase
MWVPPADDSLGEHEVSAETAAALEDAASPETRRAFAREWDRFAAWCAVSGRPALPASTATLVEYVRLVTDHHRYSPTTVERMVTAIRSIHRARSAEPPDSFATRALLRAYGKTLHDEKHVNARPRRAVPLVPSLLSTMMATLDRSTPIGRRDAAVLSLGHAIAGRGSEITRLDISDLTDFVHDDDRGLDVAVYRPKVDKDGPVAVPHQRRADQHHCDEATCPVECVRAWLDVLTEHGHTSGPLFVRVDRHGRIGADVALHRAGRPIGAPQGRIDPATVRNVVRRTAQAAGHDVTKARFSAHGLRRGLVTAARRSGARLEDIGRHGGWADGSRQLLTYIEDEDRWIQNVLFGVA